MKLSELYNLCDNLDYNTHFYVRKGYDEKLVDEGGYLDIATRWNDPEVKGLRLDGYYNRTCTIYI